MWGTYGMEKEETPSGVLVGGTDSGSVMMWNPLKIIDGEDDALIFQTDQHTGKLGFILFLSQTKNIYLVLGMTGREEKVFILYNI